jgi:hypothetical protein
LVLIYGLGICAAIWGGGRGLPALTNAYRTARSETAESIRRLNEARAAVHMRPAAAESLAARQRLLRQLAPRMFVAKTPTLLASNASAHLSRLASASQLRVASVQVDPPTVRAGQARPVRIALTAAGDVRGVMRFLAGIESARKLVRVVSISIGQPDVAGRDNLPETLNVLVTVEAFGLLAGAK